MMKSQMKLAAIALLLFGLNCQAFAETRYIKDVIYVPVRSGQSSSYRIVHKGLKSGTKVSMLEESEAGEYSKIRTSGGLEGWVRTQYLSSEPSARLQLAQAKQAIGRLTQDTQPLRAEITTLKEAKTQLSSQFGTLQTDNQALRRELTEIKKISNNAIELNHNNKELVKQNQLLKNDIDLLEADIDRLQGSTQQEWFLNGVFAVGMGGLLCLALPRLFVRRRKSSEWR